jgi:transposase
MVTIPEFARTINSFSLEDAPMEQATQFIGIDLHTNKFTCNYRDGNSQTDFKKGKRTVTYTLDANGMHDFYETLTPETYVLIEATITTFCFARLIQPMVKEVIVANTYELKQISLARTNTDKIDAGILSRIIKMQVLSGEQVVSPVVLPPVEIQELRGLYTTYRLYRKQTTQIKNRIHSLLKEKLYGFTQEEVFDQNSRQKIRALENGTSLSFQINELLDLLEFIEARLNPLKEQIMVVAEPYMREIEILTSMKGVSVFIAIAIIADIIKVDRFKNSKAFTSYLRSAPRVSNSNTSMSIRGTNKKGRKLAATLIAQSLNHVLDASTKLKRWYTELTKYKKPGLVRTGLRRRVFAEMYQMLKKDEYHYARDVRKHEAKLLQYKRFLEKRKKLLKGA